MDFTTDDWSFCFDDPVEVKLGTDPEILPYISSPEAWRQYNDDRVYEADKLTREWIAVLSKSNKWKASKGMRRYTFSMIFGQIMGRPYDCKRDAKMTNAFSRVFAYYSSRVQKQGVIAGKAYTKTIYTISPARLRKPPYSLRLRLEWMADQGMIPDSRNMALPKDLKPGHARNPKTEENMRRRREEGRKRYAGRYGKPGEARASDGR